jgi:hypothetical protein
VGSMLFYKNYNYTELVDVLHKLDGKSHTKSLYKDRDKVKASSYLPSFSALAYYRLSLRDMITTYKPDLKQLRKNYPKNSEGVGAYKKGDNHFKQAVYLLFSEAEGIVNTVGLYNFGNIFAKIADSFLSSIPHIESRLTISADIIKLFADDKFDEVKDAGNEQDVLKQLLALLDAKQAEEYFSIDFVLILMRLSSIFYRKSGRHYSYSFQYKKFLFILKDYICLSAKKEIMTDDANHYISSAEKVAERIIIINTWIQNTANRPQILKYREIFNNHEEASELYKRETEAIYRSISTSSEIRESVALVEEIKLRIARDTKSDTPKKSFPNIISPMDTISSRFTRVIELRMQAEINMYNLDILIPTKHLVMTEAENTEGYNSDEKCKLFRQYLEDTHKDLSSITKDLEKIRNYICDSIFALFEVTKTLKLYGINYVLSHSYLAGNHRKLGAWCQMFLSYEYFVDADNSRKKYAHAPSESIKDHAEKIFGKDDQAFVEPNYHYEIAAQLYNAAIQVHNGGKTYREVNQNMSFLEDDFNDNLTHFCAAAERFRINIGMVRGGIGKMKLKIKDSSVYKYKNYRLSDDDAKPIEDPSV